MVIKASSRTQIEALIADLGSERAVARESAVTGLTLIGGRALERVMALAVEVGIYAAPALAALQAESAG